MTTPAEHPDVRLLNVFLEAFGAADADRLRELMREDLVWYAAS